MVAPAACSALLVLLWFDCVSGWCRAYYQEHAKPKFPHSSCQKVHDCKHVETFEMNDETRQLVLDAHNDIRRSFAKGQRSGYPPAANMIKLVWNEELEEISRDYAQLCSFKHDPIEGRFSTRYLSLGQNLGRSRGREEVNWTRRVVSFLKELDFMTPALITKYKFDKEYGHMSQLIWAASRELGAGMHKFTNKKSELEQLYVFTFGPGGNIAGEPIYIAGKACSKCPNNTVCEDGLCAYIGTNLASRSVHPGAKTEPPKVCTYPCKREECNSEKKCPCNCPKDDCPRLCRFACEEEYRQTSCTSNGGCSCYPYPWEDDDRRANSSDVVTPTVTPK